VRDDGHAVGFAAPPRHDVLMQTCRNAGARATMPWFMPMSNPCGAITLNISVNLVLSTPRQ
jgi:hypothetical protein